MNMKKIYSILLSAAFVASSSIASAQQLPNGGFDSTWENCVPWDSNGNTKTKGKQPQDWCISHVYGSYFSATEVASSVSGYNGSTYAVELKNQYKLVAAIPSYMSLGTTWSTSVMNANNDGGSFGGIDFTYQPDAISFYYKRTHGTEKTEEPATVLAYLWKGTWTQADVPANIVMSGSATTTTMTDRDRNILGMNTDFGGTVTKTDDAELIAVLNYSITGDATEWTKFIQPIEYKSNSIPEKINVVLAANDYFAGASAVGKDNTLTVDDVKLVYYSRLSALSVGGVAVDGFSSEVYNYTMSGTTLPSADDIAVSVMGKSATYTIAVNETDATVTINVSNVDADVDGQSSHAYVLQYEKVQTGDAIDYPGYLNVNMPDLSETPLAENEPKTVTITYFDNGLCEFLLPDFTLEGLPELGDIVVSDVVVTTDENGDKSFNGYVEDMTLAEGEIVADVTLTGTISAAGVVDMKIDVMWDGIPIYCTFTSNKTTGIESIVAPVEGAVEYYNLQGVKVANPENGVFIRVQGGKATKVVK